MLYQKRPDSIDAVEVITPQGTKPPFHEPVPEWVTAGIADQTLRWTYDAGTTLTTVTLYWPNSDEPRVTAQTGDYLAMDLITASVFALSAANLDRFYAKGGPTPIV